MKWIETFMALLSKIFMPKLKQPLTIESVQPLSVLQVPEMSKELTPSEQEAKNVQAQLDLDNIIAAQKLAEEMAMASAIDAQKAQKEAEEAIARKEMAEQEFAKAQAETEKKKADLEAEIAKLQVIQAEATKAEIERKIAETQALAGRQKIRHDDFAHNADLYKHAQDEIAKIKDQEVISGVQFSPGGDAIVWIFKRIGTDVIFVGCKSFNQKDFAKRGQ